MNALLAKLTSVARQLWPWLRNALAAFGALCIVCILWVNHQYALHHPGYQAAPPIEVSPVAQRIATRFSPTLQALAAEHKTEVIGSVEGAVQRWCVGKVYDPAVAAIPRGAEIATNAALDALCNMPISEVAGDMIDHAKATGRQVDYTVWVASEQGKRRQTE